MHGFVLVRVERRAVGVDALEAAPLQHATQLARRRARRPCAPSRRRRCRRGCATAQLEAVEHREQLLEQAARSRARPARSARAARACGSSRSRPGCAAACRRSSSRSRCELREIGSRDCRGRPSAPRRPSSDAGGRRRQLVPASVMTVTRSARPSSTISASATSSSVGGGAPRPGAGAAGRRLLRLRVLRRAAARSPGSPRSALSCAALDRVDVGAGERVLQLLRARPRSSPCRRRDLVALLLEELLGLEDERVGVVADLGLLAPLRGPPRRAPRRPSSCGRSRPCRARCRR